MNRNTFISDEQVERYPNAEVKTFEEKVKTALAAADKKPINLVVANKTYRVTRINE